MVKGSPVGVRTAASMSMATTAWRRNLRMYSRVTSPKWDSTARTDGNSNRIPIRNTIDVNVDIYEVSANVFTTLPLTWYPLKK